MSRKSVLPSVMDYLEWSRVIDELSNIIKMALKTIAINEKFLEQAILERDKYPKPKKPTEQTVKSGDGG